jgi:lysozyme
MANDTLFSVLCAQLRNDEGLRLKSYTDTMGNLTIGYGRNLTGKGLTKTECEFLLSNDVRDAMIDAQKAVSNFDILSVNRQSVIANMTFNMGLAKFSAFKKMIAAIEIGDFKIAAIEMLDSRWADQVGERAQRLSKLMEFG